MAKIGTVLAAVSILPTVFAATNSTTVGQCDLLYQIPEADRCAFVMENCGDHKLGLINYFEMYYCHTAGSPTSKVGTVLATLMVLVQCFVSIGITSSEFLCPNLSTFANFLSIPENLSGLTLLALGNGSPDILGTYASFKSESASLAIGELIGSAFLITSLLIGVMSIARPFKIYNSEASLNEDKLIFYRDLTFFILSSSCVILFLADGKLMMWECLVMVVLYVLYVVMIIGWSWILQLSSRQVALEERVRNLYNFNDEEDHFNFTSADFDDDGMDKFGPSNPFNRHSLLDALEFKPALGGLRQNRPNSVRLGGDDDFGQTLDDSEGYEARQSSLDELVDSHRASIWLERLPLLKGFGDKSLLSKVFLVLTLPIYLGLTFTIPVRDQEHFTEPNTLRDKVDKNWLILQTVLAPFFIATVVGPDKYVVIEMVPIVAGYSFASYFIIYKSHDKERLRNGVHLSLCILGFISSIAWISLIASELISILKFLGNLFSLSEAILGLTLFAIGNSVGDFISNFTVANMGFPLMALAACFGGPLLNLLLGVGLNGVFVLKEYDLPYLSFEIDKTLIVSSVCLLCNLLFLFFVIPINNWKFDRWIGLIMVAIWCSGTLANVIVEAL